MPERTEERIAQYSTRRFHSHPTYCVAMAAAAVMVAVVAVMRKRVS